MLVSICGIVEWILESRAPVKAVLTVHDSIVLEVAEECLEMAARKVREIMLSHNSGDVPLKVDLEVGDSLGELVGYQLAA
jgi:DNA polymerase-1